MKDTIMEMPDYQRPYEKCLREGEQSLSDRELLAVILRCGVQGSSSLTLADKMLDGHNHLSGEQLLSRGTVNATLITPREVFVEAAKYRAVNLILVHNHPGGDPSPSQADLDVTERIYHCGELLGIHLLDHIIIGDHRYVSFREKGIFDEYT